MTSQEKGPHACGSCMPYVAALSLMKQLRLRSSTSCASRRSAVRCRAWLLSGASSPGPGSPRLLLLAARPSMPLMTPPLLLVLLLMLLSVPAPCTPLVRYRGRMQVLLAGARDQKDCGAHSSEVLPLKRPSWSSGPPM